MNAVSRLSHASDLLWAFGELQHVTVATPELLSCVGTEVSLRCPADFPQVMHSARVALMCSIKPRASNPTSTPDVVTVRRLRVSCLELMSLQHTRRLAGS